MPEIDKLAVVSDIVVKSLFSEFIARKEMTINMNDLDKLTQIQKDTINYNSSTFSLMKREYEKARKEAQKHETPKN